MTTMVDDISEWTGCGAVSILPNLAVSWARFCTRDDQLVTVVELAAGLELLKGPHGAEWLARGYEETLKAVRNTGAENILSVGVGLVEFTAADIARIRTTL